jgi:hypothetical protein
MKHLVLSLLVFTNIAYAGCNLRTASTLVNERELGEVTDLVKTNTYGACRVKFRITVNGEWHDAEAEYKGMYSDYVLCSEAIDKAKTELLINLGGKFKTEAITVCQEGSTPAQKIKIGDTILENEVGQHKDPKYFKYKEARCRMFTEHYNEQGRLVKYEGVICQINNSSTNWLVVDKW